MKKEGQGHFDPARIPPDDKKPGPKTILIISRGMKDTTMEITAASLAKGIVVKPFTKDAVSRNLAKLV